MSANTEQSCFSILVRNPNHEIIDRGTGFFINKDGFFITAGHVVKDPTCKYFALINDKEALIEVKFKEYVLQDAYRSELYMDLAFGKISYHPKSVIKLSSNQLQPGDTVELNGFSKDSPKDWAIDTDDLNEPDKNIRFYNSYSTQINSDPTIKVNKIANKHFIMTNVYALEKVMANMKGLSGGPIMYKDGCIGIVNNTQECLRSTYIMEQLTSAGVEFTTT